MDTEQEPQNNNTQTNTQNKPQQQLSEQADNYKNNKKNTKLILIIVSSILGSIILFSIIFFNVFLPIKNSIPSLQEYESYLAQKYKDDTFYYVSGNPSCVLPSSGFCEAQFSSESLNGKTFTVWASHNSFSDDYYEKRYNFSFKSYYYEKYGKLFEDTISNLAPYPIEAKIKNPYESSIRKSSFDSFDDYIDALDQQEESIEVYLMMVSGEIDIYNLNELDFALLKSKVSMVIEQNSLKISSVNFVVSSFKKEYTGTCPKEFDHTIRGGISIVYDKNDYILGVDDNPDGRSISGCSLLIYQKENLFNF